MKSIMECDQNRKNLVKNNRAENIMIKFIFFLLLIITIAACEGSETKWLSHSPKNPNSDQLIFITATAHDPDKIAKIEIYLTEYNVRTDNYCILNKCSTLELPEAVSKNTKIKECKFSSKSKQESCIAEIGPFSESAYIGYKMVAFDSKNNSSSEGYYFFETGNDNSKRKITAFDPSKNPDKA